MKTKILISCAALLAMSACQENSNLASNKTPQIEVDISDCIRTVMTLDEGRWSYTGTIAQVRGKFRTFEAIFVHASAGADIWSSKAFGGDVGGDESSAEINYSQLVGNAMVPFENGELKPQEALKYLSCIGPDPEGRYETRIEYKMPTGDGAYVTSQNMTWYSEHGSYYAEDIYKDGRVNSRRSGVNLPLNP